jgi:hypothetical protein
LLCDTELPSANVPAPIFHPNQHNITARYLPDTDKRGLASHLLPNAAELRVYSPCEALRDCRHALLECISYTAINESIKCETAKKLK